MTNDNARIQVNFKTGPGHDAALINLYAETEHELDGLLDALGERIPTIISLKQQLQAGGTVGDNLPLHPEQDAPQSYGPPQVVNPPAPAAPAPGGATPEVMTDRYGNRYTYGLADAPLLPDGRGHYIRKDWTSREGKVLKAWVDPIKGPKPAQRGAAEAELIWIR